MKIKKLEIKGFKSFPHKTEILISPRITIVVGPNGCGKTNIFEAILFALGEKNPQNLRANTWQDLIFSGNEKYSRSGVAEVAVLLEDGDEEIEIRRKILRDGRIENYINGEYISHVKWNERIYEIFPQGRSYALFKNEEIEKIIMDAPKVLKELVHSAAGIELFEKKKDTLRRRLSRVEREIERLEDLLFEKEKRLRELEKEVERLRNYWEIKNKIEFLERKKISINYYYVKRELSRKEKEREEKLKEMEIYKEKDKKYREELESVRSKISEIEGNLKELEVKEREIVGKEKGIITEKAKLMERKSNLSSRREEIIKKLGGLKEILNEIDKEIREFEGMEEKVDEEEFRREEERLKRVGEEIAGIEKEKKILEVKMASLEENIKISRERLEGDKSSFREEKEKMEKILEEIKEFKEKEKEIIEKREDLIKKIQPLNQKLETLEGEIDKKKVKVKEIETRIKYLEAEKNEGEGKFLFELLDLNDEKTVIFDKFFYYPVVGIEDVISKKFGHKAIIEEKVKDFIISEMSKILYSPDLKKLLRSQPELDQNKIYITEDGFIVEKGCVVEKIRKEKIERERQLNSLRNELKKEREILGSLIGEYERLKKERGDVLRKLNEVEETLMQIKRDLKIKETKLEVVNFSVENLENRIKENSDKLENFSEEVNKIRERVAEIDILLGKKNQEKKELEEEYKRMEGILKNIERFRYLERTKEETHREIKNSEDRLSEIEKEIKLIEENMKKITAEEERLRELKEKIEKERENLIENERILKEEEKKNLLKIEETQNDLQKLKEEIVAIQVKIEGIKERIAEFPEGIEESYPDVGIRKIEEEIEKNKKRLYEFGDVNLAAEKEYEKEKEEYDNMLSALSDVKSAREKINSAIRLLEEEAEKRFFDVYNSFTENIKDVARELLRGDVEVTLENPREPLTSDFLIKVSPFGKKVRLIHLLSGGERALLALSVIFTLHRVSPVPFCVLDEVDAALDDVNTLRFVDFIKTLSSNTQLFIITHNKRTMESGDILYGVSMEDGISKIYSLKLEGIS